MPGPGKWKSSVVADSEREYLALLSYLPLKTFRMIPKFLKYTFGIERQLRETSGLIGYAVHAEFLSKRFWTLSVWEDQRSLIEFVSKLPHSQVMVNLAPHMGQTKFTEWSVKGSEVPPGWDEGKRRMEET